MLDIDVATLSRLQFALTALYHFLFVPLTLGLSLLLAIMESVYVMTGRTVWRDATKFWGTLFGINFAMGVATGVTMEFQFGTNWAYYSHYVGDIFGAPLAIEGSDGVLSGGDLRRPVFLRLEAVEQGSASRRDLAGRFGQQFLGAVDSRRQQLDAKSGRRAFQSADDAHGADLLHRGSVQSGRAIEIRPHGQRRLCDGRDVRDVDRRLLHAARAPSSTSRGAPSRSRRVLVWLRRSRSSCSATRAATPPA